MQWERKVADSRSDRTGATSSHLLSSLGGGGGGGGGEVMSAQVGISSAATMRGTERRLPRSLVTSPRAAHRGQCTA